MADETPAATAPAKPAAKPAAKPRTRLLEKYATDVLPALKAMTGRDNVLSLPKITKIVLNMGVGKALQDKNRIGEAVEHLGLIAGQRPQVTKAKKSVSAFRLREGQEIGCRVTLRGNRAYEFLDRFIHLTLPRIRDFRGVSPKSFDGNGNYNMGLADQLAFAEIDPDKVNFTQGMDITVCTTASNDEEARELLKLLGMPFRE